MIQIHFLNILIANRKCISNNLFVTIKLPIQFCDISKYYESSIHFYDFLFLSNIIYNVSQRFICDRKTR